MSVTKKNYCWILKNFKWQPDFDTQKMASKELEEGPLTDEEEHKGKNTGHDSSTLIIRDEVQRLNIDFAIKYCTWV